jgi:hypothetical protein
LRLSTGCRERGGCREQAEDDRTGEAEGEAAVQGVEWWLALLDEVGGAGCGEGR